jgi:hypothetical protein
MKEPRQIVWHSFPATCPARRLPACRVLKAASLLAALAFAAPASAGVCYVNGAAAGANDGSSWTNAYLNPQGALGNASCTEIWIAAGTYLPTATTDRTISFVVLPGVAVYGGFAGNEVARGQRDPAANVTILSGNIDDPNNPFDNSYHVVVIDGTTAAGPVGNDTVLDGLTITEGDASSSSGPGSGAGQGGGIYCNGFSANTTAAGHACSPTLTNLMITNNDGGGLYNDAYEGTASPVITNVTFAYNAANGGGMASYASGAGSSAKPLLTNVTFVSNTGNYGGAINNSAAYGGQAEFAVINGTFSGNHANNGAAIYNNAYNARLDSGTLAVSFVSNSIIWDGAASNEIVNVYDNNPLHHTAYSNLTGVDINGCPPNGASCSPSINADPLLGVPADNGGSTLTMLPASNSPVINAGIDSGCLQPDGSSGACPGIDQRGVARPQGAHPDMGSVEVRALRCYVNQAASGNNDGTSWTNAYTDLQSALAGGKCADVWIAAGTYRPTSGSDRTIAFNVARGVAVHGGFAGGETALSQRHPSLNNPTTLSGDIGTQGDVSDNSYHVVILDGTTAAGPIDGDTVLDSLVITAGNANAATPNDRGAGVYCIGDGARCNPTLSNLYFLGVSGTQTVYGGALFNSGIGGTSSPTILNTTFAGNSATQRGGAIYNYGSGGGTSSPVITNVTFSGNQSPSGGGIFNDGYNGTSSPVVTNATFNGNSATNGPAMYDVTTGGQARPQIVNSVLWGEGVPEIYSEGCPPFPQDNSACVPSIAYSDVIAMDTVPAWFADAGGVFDANPGFAALADNGGFAPTYIPPPDVASPVMDAADDAACPATDERGVIRPRNAHCDMGATEIAYSRIFADGFDGVPVP